MHKDLLSKKVETSTSASSKLASSETIENMDTIPKLLCYAKSILYF